MDRAARGMIPGRRSCPVLPARVVAPAVAIKIHTRGSERSIVWHLYKEVLRRFDVGTWALDGPKIGSAPEKMGSAAGGPRRLYRPTVTAEGYRPGVGGVDEHQQDPDVGHRDDDRGGDLCDPGRHRGVAHLPRRR